VKELSFCCSIEESQMLSNMFQSQMNQLNNQEKKLLENIVENEKEKPTKESLDNAIKSILVNYYFTLSHKNSVQTFKECLHGDIHSLYPDNINQLARLPTWFVVMFVRDLECGSKYSSSLIIIDV
jgi:hypothetical protein